MLPVTWLKKRYYSMHYFQSSARLIIYSNICKYNTGIKNSLEVEDDIKVQS